MQVVSVIPLSRGVHKDTLTYFSGQALAPGAIVSVPIRNKLIPALVIESTPAEAVKSTLRSADFPVKRVKNVLCPALVRPAFILAAMKMARYAAAPLGVLLPALLPQALVTSCKDVTAGIAGEDSPSPLRPDLKVLQNNDQERISSYKSLIREEFAKNQSVILCAPTHIDAINLTAALGRGIEEYTFTLHGKLTKKTLLQTWNDALALRRPILLIATPQFIGLPRHDIKTFIVDKESAGAYKSLSRPHLDYRRWCEYLSSAVNGRILYGDISLRIETRYRLERGELQPAESVKQRLISPAASTIIRAASGEVITAETEALLRQAAARSEHIFLLAGRRGLAPLVVCNDCGSPVLCERCQSPVSLHLSGPGAGADKAHFLCHRCGAERSAREQCQVCTSWKLQELGTGVEKVAEATAELLPEATVFLIDSDSVSSSKKARELISRFWATPGAILVGTEMALYYLHEPVDTSLVIAADSLLSLPDFRIHERLFTLLTRLRTLSTKRFVIQTRYPDEPVFTQAAAGNVVEFYRQELEDRRSFGYPPFTTLIKITLMGDRMTVRPAMKQLAEQLAPHQPALYPSFQSIHQGRYRLNILLKIDPDKWPNEELLSTLKSLPPSFIVNIDPHDIL